MKLNLRLFDEGAPAEGTTAETGEGTKEGAAPEGPTPEERMKTFKELIKGEYRDLYDAEVQNIVKSRIADSKKLEGTIREQAEVLDLVSRKYGIQSGKAADIRAALEGDDNFWEQGAAEQGMSVESYKKMMKLEAENETLRRAREEAERKNQKDEVFRRWDAEVERVKELYPSFDLNTELQDKRFADLMGAGIDIKTIYETLHHEEIMPLMMSQAAAKATKAQADAIKAGMARPKENGMSSQPAKQLVKDPSKMTREERAEYARRAARGEIITFQE